MRSSGMNNMYTYKRYYPAGIALAVAVAGLLTFKFAFDVDDAARKASVDSRPQVSAPQKPAQDHAITQSEEKLAALLAARVEEESAELRALYAHHQFAPLWIKTRAGAQRVKELALAAASAEAQGIETTKLAQYLIAANDRELGAEEAVATDVALSREALRLAEALRLGAVSRSVLGRSWIMPADTFNAAESLSGALDKKGGIKNFMSGLAPSDPQYKDLVAAFQTYRDIVESGGWPQIPGTEEVMLDMTDPRTPQLRARLEAEGYLRSGGTLDSVLLTEAVKQFQTRHGLEPDGRVGKGTLAALNVPAHVRAAQIAANMERWRQTPRDRGDMFVAVNTASTTLDFVVRGESVLKLNVVAGTKRHATPIMTAPISSIVLNPAWSVPPSITRNEIVPKLRQDPNYLANNNMVLLDAAENDPHGLGIDWVNYDGPVRVRQRPGDDNALGYLKFQMTNPQNIYLHDTPSRAAFAKYERHLSHGCIRVETPAKLAEYVLMQTGGDWNEESITAEIQKGKPRSIALDKPVPVYIHYWTAFSEDGVMHFRKDIYDRDRAVIAALGKIAPVQQVTLPERQKVAQK